MSNGTITEVILLASSWLLDPCCEDPQMQGGRAETITRHVAVSIHSTGQLYNKEDQLG